MHSLILCSGLTFNQLLAKYGYIEDESMTKKQRIREWHVNNKVKTDDDSDSDSVWNNIR